MENDFLRKWGISIIIGVLCISGIISIIYTHEKGSLSSVGDAFNGILSPILTTISIILIYKTYSAAIEANREISKGNLLSQILHEMQDFTEKREKVWKIIMSVSYYDDYDDSYVGVEAYENSLYINPNSHSFEDFESQLRIFFRFNRHYNNLIPRFTIISEKYKILDHYTIKNERNQLSKQYRTLSKVYKLIVDFCDQPHLKLNQEEKKLLNIIKNEYEITLAIIGEINN